LALTLVFNRIYPEGNTYVGNAKQVTMEWYGPPSPLDFEWLAEDIINQSVKQDGGTLLRLQFWSEEAYDILGYPVVYHYKLEADCHSSPFNPYVIIAAVMAVLIIIAVILWEIKDIWWGGPLGPGIGEVLLAAIYGSVIIAGLATVVYFYRKLKK
jgi:hypothetical protein